MVSTQGHQAHVNCNYIDELQDKFKNVKFERTGKTKGRYITNLGNKSTLNDLRIFIEMQIKRILRSLFAPFISKAVKNSRVESWRAYFRVWWLIHSFHTEPQSKFPYSRFQLPPHQTQHAVFPHYAFLVASLPKFITYCTGDIFGMWYLTL